MYIGETNGAFISLASVTKSILNIKGHCLNGLIQAVLCLTFPAGGSCLDCALFFPVSRSTKSPRLLSMTGEAARAFVLPSNTHLESSETPTSRRLTREGVSVV